MALIIHEAHVYKFIFMDAVVKTTNSSSATVSQLYTVNIVVLSGKTNMSKGLPRQRFKTLVLSLCRPPLFVLQRGVTGGVGRGEHPPYPGGLHLHPFLPI